jgi:hypothetical protein
VNQPIDEHHAVDAVDAERMRRASKVWQHAKPSNFEIAMAENRLHTRARARDMRWIGYVIVPAVVATVTFFALSTRHAATPIGPVTERTERPAIGKSVAAVDMAARDVARLNAAEALHRSGQCRAAKPELEDLSARGATPDVRARAKALLDEIGRQPAEK